MSGNIKYRSDIDGLRAIAVTTVVLFHARLPGLVGGFTGVDIFFVISGYLITGLLVAEHAMNGRISIADFYARRVRRLLPALLVVVLVTLALGMAMLPPTGDLQSLGKSAIAALFFVSNVFFFRQPSGYFAGAAEAFPLLHTWTLAVEEQFYIVWPLLLPLIAWGAARVGLARERALIICFALIGVLSFTLCQIVLNWRPMGAFYLTPFRAWEFAIGALLAMLLPRWHGASIKAGFFTSLVGLAAIIAGFVLINSRQPFPGYEAMLPVLGAAAMLAGGAIAPASPVSRLLSTGPFVYVGKISYGWYLWHWPLLAFSSFYAEGAPSHGVTAGAVVLAFFASSASYHLIEAPIRMRRVALFRGTRATLLAGLGLLLVGGFAALCLLWRAEGVLGASPQLQLILEANSTELKWPVECTNYRVPYPGLVPAATCTLGNTDAKQGVMLWGDSHAYALIPMFDGWAKARDMRLLPRTKGGCRPFGGEFLTTGLPLSPPNLRDCGGFNKDVRAEFVTARQAGITTVVIASRWPYGSDDYPYHQMAKPDLWSSELAETVTAARSAGLLVVLPVDVPLFDKAVPQCLTRHSAEQCRADAGAYTKRRSEFIAVARPLVAHDQSVRILDLSSYFCPAAYCQPFFEEVVLYRDRHHLSVAGSAAVGQAASDALDSALLP